MIIFRVTTGRSFTNFPTSKDGGLSTGKDSKPLQFAHQTAESSFLQSTLNQEFGRSLEPDTERGLNARVNESGQSQPSVIHIEQEKRNDGGYVEKAN